VAIFLAVNWILAAMLAILDQVWHKRSRESAAVFLLIAAFSVGGLIIAVLLFYKSGQHADSPEEIQQQIDSIHRQSESYHFIPVLNEDDDYHAVPLEETLLIANFTERRKAVLGVMRRDINQYSQTITLAIRNEDSETAHYAASSLLHQKRKLDRRLSELAAEMSEDPYNPDKMMAYADRISDYIRISDPSDGMIEVYRERSAQVLLSLIDLQKPVPVKYPTELLAYLTAIRDWETAARIEHLLMTRFPESETRAMALLSYYFTTRNIERFNQVCHDLRESSMIVSPQLMDNLQFWAGDSI